METPSDALRSPRALLIFEAVVRTGSCTAAAREFNLTQPSVSRNIAQLEAALGAPLFTRKTSGLEPTPEALLLYQTVSDSLQRIEETITIISQRSQRRQAVVLSLSTAFVTHWFVPRMRLFQQTFPDVDLRFELTSGALRGAIGNVDLAMRRTDGTEPRDHCWPFLPEVVLPVCSRSYLERHGPLKENGSPGGHILLELTETEIGWRMLLGAHADRVIKGGTWLEFSDYAVVLQTALSGQGVALGWVSAVSRMLAEGALVPASSLRLETGRQFCLLAHKGRPVRDVVHCIRNWMVEEMRLEYETLMPLIGERSPAWRTRDGFVDSGSTVAIQ